MKRAAALVFTVAVALYLPTARFGFVLDDRAIVATNPAAHSATAALRAVADPYWPAQSGGGLWRPLTIASFALDWWASGGRASWLHLGNALWHGVACVLVLLLLRRWLAPAGATVAALVFALHPVHVEAVASLVGRSELLATCGVLAAVLAALRGKLLLALGFAALGMLAKESAVVVGVVILLADWLDGNGRLRHPARFYVALAALTVAYFVAWRAVGGAAAADVAPPFLHGGVGRRLAVALPAILRAGGLLVWPARLSADYGPQVIPVRDGPSLAAAGGALLVVVILGVVWWGRRRSPVLSLAAGVAALSYLPTANLLFPSGVVLAERNLYLAALVPAAALGAAAAALVGRARHELTLLGAVLILLSLAIRSVARLPAWRDNRAYLVTLLTDHPESYQAHSSAAAVYAGMGDTAAARRSYELATELFGGDPHLLAARAWFVLGLGDTATARTLTARARELLPRERVALRAAYALALGAGQFAAAQALADSARFWYRADSAWYRTMRQ